MSTLKFRTTDNILEASFGEVTATTPFIRDKPNDSGLFCQRIFGPVVSYSCSCKALVNEPEKTCVVCGVDCCSSTVRAERFGHIQLPYPVLHPLFIDIVAKFLGISKKFAQSIILTKKRFILEKGALPSSIIQNFSIVANEGEGSATGSFSLYKVCKLISFPIKRAKISESQKEAAKLLERNNLTITDLFLQAIPVLPPDLRPYVTGSDGIVIVHSTNELYTTVLQRVRRINAILENNKIVMPQVIEEVSVRALQKSVIDLFVEGATNVRGEITPSILDSLKGKTGFIRGNIMGKRVDYSGRCAIASGPELPLDTIKLPEVIGYELFKPFIIRDLLEAGYAATYGEAKRLYKKKSVLAIESLYFIIPNHFVLLNRQPTLHRQGIMAFKVELHRHHLILFPPMVTAPYNLDFDGDTMAIYLPLSTKARNEAKSLLAVTNNQRSLGTGEPSLSPSHEMVLGIDYMCRSEEKKLNIVERSIKRLQIMEEARHLKINTLVTFRKEGKSFETTLGRLLLEEALGVSFPSSIDKQIIKQLITESYEKYGTTTGLSRLKKIQDLAFHYVTKSGISICLDDVKEPQKKQEIVSKARAQQQEFDQQLVSGKLKKSSRYENVVRLWQTALSDLFKEYEKTTDPSNPVYAMYRTGARVSKAQVAQLVTAKGMFTRADNTIMEVPITNTLRSGLTPQDYFISCSGSRKSMADKVFITPRTGYFARKLVSAARDLYVLQKDCGTSKSLSLPSYMCKGRTVLGKDRERIDHFLVRSPVLCEGKKGICQKCYGEALSSKEEVSIGEPVGVVAASAFSEPATQLSMRTFHTSGSVSLSESSLVVRAQNEGHVTINKYKEHVVVAVGNLQYFIHNHNTKILVLEQQVIEKGTILAVYEDTNLQNEDIAATLPLLESYFELQTVKKDEACLRAPFTGKVQLSSSRAGITISINDTIVGITRCAPVLVYNSECVVTGHKLTYGITDIHGFYKITQNLETTASLFIDCVLDVYKQNGTTINSVHAEVLFRSMSELVQGDVVGLRRFGDKGDILLKGITAVSRDYPSWLKGITFGWVKKHIINATLSGEAAYDLPSERIMQGRRTSWKE